MLEATDVEGLRGALVVDPDVDCRELICSTLARIHIEARQGASGQDALEVMARVSPLLLILEVTLPDMSGFELCREVRDAYGAEVGIILLSGEHTESVDRVAGLLIGADDYLVKPFDPDELLARARNLLRRIAPLSSERPANLTPREHEIICLLAEGLTQDQIADRLVISPRTVATHLERILAKAGVHSRAQAVSWAYRQGLIR
jgi:DNA-binding response OmpR family regulator